MLTVLILFICLLLVIPYTLAAYCFSPAGFRHYYRQRGGWRFTLRLLSFALLTAVTALALFLVTPLRMVHGPSLPYSLVFLSLAAMAFLFAAPYRAQVAGMPVKLRLVGAALFATAVFALLVMAANVATSHVGAWLRERMYGENFTAPELSAIHNLEGGNSALQSDNGWLAFDYDGDLMKRNPDSYKKATCREAHVLTNKKHFTAGYVQFYAPLLKCEEGQRPYTGADGKQYYYHTYLIMDPIMRHAEFEIKE
jgi:hypothetical protein